MWKQIRAAKEAWFEDRCLEIDKLVKKRDVFNFHKKIKTLTKYLHKYIST